jgi:hypothetical protein
LPRRPPTPNRLKNLETAPTTKDTDPSASLAAMVHPGPDENSVQFGYAVPAILQQIVFRIEDGVPFDEVKKWGWLTLHTWKYSFA